MIKKLNRPITGTNTAMQPKAPVQTKVGATAQRQIVQPPQPFANPKGAKNVPTGNVRGDKLGIPYTVPAPPNARTQNIGKAIGCATTSLSDSEMAAVGYSPSATKGSWSLISGHATKNNSKEVGGGNQPMSKGRK